MKNRKVMVALLSVGLLFVALSAGCLEPRTGDVELVEKTIAVVVDYGSGVYYFDSTGAEFANSLSSFIQTHPELEVVSIAGDGDGIHGVDKGYFVVFRQKITNTTATVGA
jgi:hypothetical protein